jgi:hypothetical protein
VARTFTRYSRWIATAPKPIVKASKQNSLVTYPVCRGNYYFYRVFRGHKSNFSFSNKPLGAFFDFEINPIVTIDGVEESAICLRVVSQQ